MAMALGALSQAACVADVGQSLQPISVMNRVIIGRFIHLLGRLLQRL
jgi:hypothetical protein